MDKDRLRAQLSALTHEELVERCVAAIVERNALVDMRAQYVALVAALDDLRSAAVTPALGIMPPLPPLPDVQS